MDVKPNASKALGYLTFQNNSSISSCGINNKWRNKKQGMEGYP